MITFSHGAKIKEFVGHLILATWGFYLIAGYLPVGVNIASHSLLRGILTAFTLAAAYGFACQVIAAVCAVRSFGRFGELLLGWCVSSYTIWLIATGQLFFDGGMHVNGVFDAIAGGAIVTTLVGLIATITGRINWYDDSLWVVRKLPVDANDHRCYEAYLDSPSVVRIDHEDRTVFEEVMSGNVKLMMRDYTPYQGKTVIWVDGEFCGVWTVDF